MSSKTALQSNETLLFIGDSITDCSRRERDIPLGVGYVRFFSDLLTIREPQKKVQIINRGISGHTVDDLRSRWTDHVLAHRPDWLSIKIGINDLNRHLAEPTRHVFSPEGYAEIYDEILTLTRRELPRTQLLVISPFFTSRDRTPNSYRAQVLNILPRYIGAAREAAARHQARFVDLQSGFEKLMDHVNPDLLCEDAVHPQTAGALFIAEQVYEALREG
jgi:lysophospholipase L1-like esterase